jgi:capsular polysaccharide biosynthesis protein
MCPNFPPHRPLWRFGTASPMRYLLERRRQGGSVNGGRASRARHVPVAIALRHFWEWNYYHFYFDVLGKLSLLRDAGVSEDIPIVLGPYAARFPWAREILSRGDLARRTWIIPSDDEFVWADEVIYCRTQQDYKYKMDFVLDALGVDRDAERRDDRIFLDRADAKFRHISNYEEIKPIFEEFGFRRVDTLTGLSVADQIRLFANTRHLVAVHGAGITNVLFRRDAPMSVLELHAANYVSTDFKRMCKEYGHWYGTLPGAPDGQFHMHANFTIAPGRLREVLREMVAGP